MNDQLTAEQFNALLHQIDAATDVQLHEELRAAYERIAELKAALEECEGHFDSRSDVNDGDYGVPEANAEMIMLTIVRNALCDRVLT